MKKNHKYIITKERKGQIIFIVLILLAVAMTLWGSRLLSSTLLRGMPSSFSLELPPYRAPQVGQVLLRSVFDRTLFVLGRAVAVAAPVVAAEAEAAEPVVAPTIRSLPKKSRRKKNPPKSRPKLPDASSLT